MGDINKVQGYHVPVLLNESLDLWISDAQGLYIDGTLGGGGHTSEALKKLISGGKLIAFDKDPDAIKHCSQKFADYLSATSPLLELCHAGFEEAYSKEDIRGKVKGVLLDLGVSSKQLDDPSRGITYRIDSNLDMRFTGTGKSAKDVLHVATEEELIAILRRFGEEPFAVPIARRIVERRAASSLNTSFDLVNIVENTVPKKIFKKSLSRVFQAIRIAVNEELDVLSNTLTNIMPILAPGGRVVVISYHSLEDRIVKEIFKELAGPRVHKNKYSKDDEHTQYELLTHKPIVPSKEELELNPRSRSAKLRAIQKNF